MTKSQLKKIAVFRALQLGDMLCAVPSIRALRQAYPTAKITLIGLPWAKEFVRRFKKYLDDFIPFPGYPGLPEQRYNKNEILLFFKSIQKKEFDAIIQMHGDGSITNRIFFSFKIKIFVGFYSQKTDDFEFIFKKKHNNTFLKLACPESIILDHYPENLPEIERCLTLLKLFGVYNTKTALEFPISVKEENELLLLNNFKKLKGKQYICIHPGARDPKRQWNPLYFSYTADKLAQEGFSVVFTGTKEEFPLIKQVISKMHKPSINFAGKTTLGILGALIKHSQLLISNCTGVVHIADALDVPSTVIYLASDPKQWAPFNKLLHNQILPEEAIYPQIVVNKSIQLLKHTPNNSVQKGEYYAN